MADASSDKTRLVVNQPYDESFSIYDDEEVASELTPTPRGNRDSKMKKGNPDQMKAPLISDDDEEEFEHDDDYEAPNNKPVAVPGKVKPLSGRKGSAGGRPPPGGHVIQASDDDDDEEEEDDEDDDDEDESSDDDGKGGKNHEGTYDPAEYEHLPVSQEIRELFNYITRYTPQSIDLDYKLKPFIPDYIPAVGDIDAFLKVSCKEIAEVTTQLRKRLDLPDKPAVKEEILNSSRRGMRFNTSADAERIQKLEEQLKRLRDIIVIKNKQYNAVDRKAKNLTKLNDEFISEIEKLRKACDFEQHLVATKDQKIVTLGKSLDERKMIQRRLVCESFTEIDSLKLQIAAYQESSSAAGKKNATKELMKFIEEAKNQQIGLTLKVKEIKELKKSLREETDLQKLAAAEKDSIVISAKQQDCFTDLQKRLDDSIELVAEKSSRIVELEQVAEQHKEELAATLGKSLDEEKNWKRIIDEKDVRICELKKTLEEKSVSQKTVAEQKDIRIEELDKKLAQQQIALSNLQKRSHEATEAKKMLIMEKDIKISNLNRTSESQREELETISEKFKTIIGEKDNRVLRLKNVLEEQRQDSAHLVLRHTTLFNNQKLALEKSLVSKDAQIQTLRAKQEELLANTEEEKKSFSQRLDEKDSEIGQLKNDQKLLQEQVEGRKDADIKHELVLASAEEKLQIVGKELDAKNAEISQLKNDQTSLQNQIEDLANRIIDSEVENVQLRDDGKALPEQIEDLANRIIETEVENVQLRADKKALQEQNDSNKMSLHKTIRNGDSGICLPPKAKDSLAELLMKDAAQRNLVNAAVGGGKKNIDTDGGIVESKNPALDEIVGCSGAQQEKMIGDEQKNVANVGGAQVEDIVGDNSEYNKIVDEVADCSGVEQEKMIGGEKKNVANVDGHQVEDIVGDNDAVDDEVAQKKMIDENTINDESRKKALDEVVSGCVPQEKSIIAAGSSKSIINLGAGSSKSIANLGVGSPKSITNLGTGSSKSITNLGVGSSKSIANLGVGSAKSIANLGVADVSKRNTAGDCESADAGTFVDEIAGETTGDITSPKNSGEDPLNGAGPLNGAKRKTPPPVAPRRGRKGKKGLPLVPDVDDSKHNDNEHKNNHPPKKNISKAPARRRKKTFHEF